MELELVLLFRPKSDRWADGVEPGAADPDLCQMQIERRLRPNLTETQIRHYINTYIQWWGIKYSPTPRNQNEFDERLKMLEALEREYLSLEAN